MMTVLPNIADPNQETYSEKHISVDHTTNFYWRSYDLKVFSIDTYIFSLVYLSIPDPPRPSFLRSISTNNIRYWYHLYYPMACLYKNKKTPVWCFSQTAQRLARQLVLALGTASRGNLMLACLNWYVVTDHKESKNVVFRQRGARLRSLTWNLPAHAPRDGKSRPARWFSNTGQYDTALDEASRRRWSGAPRAEKFYPHGNSSCRAVGEN